MGLPVYSYFSTNFFANFVEIVQTHTDQLCYRRLELFTGKRVKMSQTM
jgi:hypothetical protein